MPAVFFVFLAALLDAYFAQRFLRTQACVLPPWVPKLKVDRRGAQPHASQRYRQVAVHRRLMSCFAG